MEYALCKSPPFKTQEERKSLSFPNIPLPKASRKICLHFDAWKTLVFRHGRESDGSEMTFPSEPRPELRPEPRLQPLPADPASRNRVLWGGGGLIAALTVGAGAFFYTHNTTTLPTPPMAPLSQNSPAVPVAQTAAVQLSMLPTAKAPAALAKSGFSPDDQARILAAVKDGKMRLVEMPVLDASGAVGQIIDLTVSGLTQRVVLNGRFQHLVIPIAEAGQILIAPVSMPHAPALIVGALTAFGPEALPALTTLDQRVLLNVIVQ